MNLCIFLTLVVLSSAVAVVQSDGSINVASCKECVINDGCFYCDRHLSSELSPACICGDDEYACSSNDMLGFFDELGTEGECDNMEPATAFERILRSNNGSNAGISVGTGLFFVVIIIPTVLCCCFIALIFFCCCSFGNGAARDGRPQKNGVHQQAGGESTVVKHTTTYSSGEPTTTATYVPSAPAEDPKEPPLVHASVYDQTAKS